MHHVCAWCSCLFEAGTPVSLWLLSSFWYYVAPLWLGLFLSAGKGILRYSVRFHCLRSFSRISTASNLLKHPPKSLSSLIYTNCDFKGTAGTHYQYRTATPRGWATWQQVLPPDLCVENQTVLPTIDATVILWREFTWTGTTMQTAFPVEILAKTGWLSWKLVTVKSHPTSTLTPPMTLKET